MRAALPLLLLAWVLLGPERFFHAHFLMRFGEGKANAALLVSQDGT